MIERLVADLGPWNWMVLGLLLLTLEMLAPGVFLLWIGIAALIVGTASLLLWEHAFWGWQLQVVIFLVLALISAFSGKKIMGKRGDLTDQPLLNRRAEQFVGRIATLGDPIRDGQGRLKLDDTMWRISGPDLPAGTRVRVASVGSSDLELIVEAA